MEIIQLKNFNSNNRDYTYCNYENKKFVGQSVIQSLFNGTQFIKCYIEKCNFSRCDYEGMNISKTNILDSDYKNADIKSVVWKDCSISGCIFDEAYITNNIFTNCEFNNCSFAGSVFLKNTINNTKFNDCNIEQSTFSLNTFNECTFCFMSLGNCSFYKQILNSCKYYKVSMNIDSLGQVFGLNQDLIKDITYIFLGKEYGNIKEYGIERLFEIFKQKDWLFEEIFLKYNCGKISNYDMIVAVVTYFSEKINTKQIIKEDEFEFFILITNFLKDNEKLPLFALIHSYQILYEKLTLLPNKMNDLNVLNIKSFMNQVFLVINEMLEKYYCCFNIQNTIYQQECIISIHYENKNIIYFHNLINELDKIINLGIKIPAKLVEVRQGTYIEIIISTVLGVSALQFFLYGVNGILLQLIDLKAKLKVLKSKNPPNYIMALTREGKQLQPEVYNLIMNNFKDKNLQDLFVKYASQLKDTEFISIENNNE